MSAQEVVDAELLRGPSNVLRVNIGRRTAVFTIWHIIQNALDKIQKKEKSSFQSKVRVVTLNPAQVNTRYLRI